MVLREVEEHCRCEKDSGDVEEEKEHSLIPLAQLQQFHFQQRILSLYSPSEQPWQQSWRPQLRTLDVQQRTHQHSKEVADLVAVVLHDIENVAVHTDKLPTLDKHDDAVQDVVVVVDI